MSGTLPLLEDGHQYDYEIEGPRNSQLWNHRYLLYLEDITAVFDGFTALNIKDMGIGHNELRVVVGPNGAGKTTMCDVVSGLTKPTTGKVYFNNEIITGQDETAIAQLGVGRKFQIPNVFSSLTVWQNMLLSLPTKPWEHKDHGPSHDPTLEGAHNPITAGDTSRKGTPKPNLLKRALMTMLNTGGRAKPEARDRIHGILERVRLIDELNTVAKNLSHGQRQWLAISALIIADPKLLLVDEPAAGLTDSETALTAELLSELKEEHTIICIEHDMEFVRQLDSRVTVLNEGKVLAEGTLDEVQSNEEVIEAYLGR